MQEKESEKLDRRGGTTRNTVISTLTGRLLWGVFNTDEKKSNIRQYSIKFRSKSCEETIIFAKAKKTYGTGC